MSAIELLQDLAGRAVQLEVAGDRLRVDAPSGVLTDADRRALADNKEELLGLLSEEDRLVAAVQVARRRAWGRSEWPVDPAACQELGRAFDAIDTAWLARHGLNKAVLEALAIIGRLSETPNKSGPCESGK